MNLVTPIKIQGKKTKIIDKIRQLSKLDGKLYVEPFLGSGEVLFNLNPEYAYVSDNNTHLINFYKAIQTKEITSKKVRDFLEFHGSELLEKGKEYYYEMRKEFNDNKNPLYFLFLNRSCFNGVIRFNNKGYFNVPFCNKNNRFAKAYVTKIVNQVEKIETILIEKGEKWSFIVSDWEDTVKKHENDDNAFFYFDPPYVNRHATYFDVWTEETNSYFFEKLTKLRGDFVLSNWYANKYRTNDELSKYFNNSDFEYLLIDHYYHIGGNIENRNGMTECLIVKK